MIWLILVVLAAQLAVYTGSLIWLRREYRRERQRIADNLSQVVHDFVSAPSPDVPSPLAVLMDTAAALLATRLMHHIKSMLGGIESKSQQGEQLNLLNEASAENPLLSLLSNILPARIRNRLARNPQIIGALSKLGGNHQPTGVEVAPRKHRE
jgi:hypothetical protein